MSEKLFDKIDRSVISYLKAGMEMADSRRLSEMRHAVANVRQLHDLPYINDGDPAHLLDIYFADGAMPDAPVIVNIHGGALIYGQKELNTSFGCELARRGFRVVNINYRLLPDTTLLGQLHDIAAVFHFLEDHRLLYDINTDRLHIVGDSAGALLSYLITSAFQNDIFRLNLPDFAINGLGLISIMLDTRRRDILAPITHFIASDEEKMLDAYRYLDHPESLKTPLPKTFLITSEEDIIRDETLRLSEILKHRGIDHILHDLQKGAQNPLIHVFPVIHPHYDESIQVLDEMTAFFGV